MERPAASEPTLLGHGSPGKPFLTGANLFVESTAIMKILVCLCICACGGNGRALATRIACHTCQAVFPQNRATFSRTCLYVAPQRPTVKYHADQGSTMDYIEDEDGLREEFVFDNPQAKGMCGCGESWHT